MPSHSSARDDNALQSSSTNVDRRGAADNGCNAVILGAGIIGCATAYYLSRSGNTRPDSIHLVEASAELFASASGKSGGFVAEDWFGPATASLGALSFRLHRELDKEHDGYKNWGYSRSTGTSFTHGDDSRINHGGEDWMRDGGSRAQAAQDPGFHEFGTGSGPSWLNRRKGDTVETIGEEGSVAQVDPLRLCQFLLKQCIASGVQLHHPARAVRLAKDQNNDLSGVQIRYDNGNELKIPCTRLLISAGAWTSQVFDTLFPSSPLSIPVTAYAGHSIVVRSPRWTREHETNGCHAIFTTMESGFSPEIFSRIGEEIYVAGLNSSSIPLPKTAGEAEIQPEAIAELARVAKELLGEDGTDVSDLEVIREGLCFRPMTRNGNPILTKVRDEDLGGIGTLEASEGGVFVCAGHGPWGISQSLGSGKVMSEMIEGVKLSADVKRLGLR